MGRCCRSQICRHGKAHRLKYWRSVYDGPDDQSDEVPFGDPAAIASAHEIQVWLTTELADQIGFVWMAANFLWCAREGGPLSSISR
jgi:hypothetical protein